VFGAQCDPRVRLHAMSGFQAQPPALPDRGQKQRAFHPRKALSDTHSCASAERKIRKLRTRRIVGEPAQRMRAIQASEYLACFTVRGFGPWTGKPQYALGAYDLSAN